MRTLVRAFKAVPTSSLMLTYYTRLVFGIMLECFALVLSSLRLHTHGHELCVTILWRMPMRDVEIDSQAVISHIEAGLPSKARGICALRT